MFSRGKTGMIGIDISDFSLEAVQLAGQYGKSAYAVQSWSRTTIPAGVMKAGHIMKPDEFREAVRALLSKPNFGSMDGKQVVCALPEHHCFHVTLSASKWNLETTLFAQVQETLNGKIPYSLNEVYWDWRVVREDNKQSYVYAFAVPRDLVDGYREALNGIGMHALFFEPQVLSAARALWKSPLQEVPSILIDIGTRETTVATIDDLGVHQSSMVSNGADHWADDLVKQLKITPETALKIMRTLGMRRVKHPNAEALYAMLERNLEPIIREAKQHITFYNVQPHIQPAVIKQLVVIGGGAAVPGITEYIAHALSLEIAGPSLPYALKPPLGSIETLLLTNALGAALRGVMTAEQQANELNVFSPRKLLKLVNESVFEKWKRLFTKKIT